MRRWRRNANRSGGSQSRSSSRDGTRALLRATRKNDALTASLALTTPPCQLWLEGMLDDSSPAYVPLGLRVLGLSFSLFSVFSTSANPLLRTYAHIPPFSPPRSMTANSMRERTPRSLSFPAKSLA